MESAEGIGLHDALAALADSGTRLPMPQEMHILRSEVIEAAIALDRLAEPGFLPASPVARVLTNLDAEIFTVTTVAENVSAFLPDGEDHDAVVEIFEAGTRAAADVVRLRTVIVPGS